MSKSKNKSDHATIAEMLAPHVESAREKAAPVIADAKVKAAPLVAEAKQKATPTLNEARDRFTHEVLPVLTAAVAAATEATEEVRDEAKKRGMATAAALKGELEPPRRKERHPVRNLLVLLGLGGIVAFVMKKLSDREATTAWQSSYQPTPQTGSGSEVSSQTATSTSLADETPIGTAAASTTAAGSAGTNRTDDEAASTLDEAVADAAVTPHTATTPDNPTEQVHIDKE